MSMLSGKVTVPVGEVVPIASVGGVNPNSISVATAEAATVTGRLNLSAMGLATTVIYVHASPGSVPDASTVVARGTPVAPGNPPVCIEDPTAAFIPDMTKYYAAVSGVVAGDLRVLG